MNTTLDCQHANPELVLPLIIETHKERTYGVHVEGENKLGFGWTKVDLKLCLVCGQVFVPDAERIDLLGAMIAAKQERERRDAATGTWTLRDHIRKQQEEAAAADLAANHGIPASKRPPK